MFTQNLGQTLDDQSYITKIIQNSHSLTDEAKEDLLHYALHAANEAKKAKRYYYTFSTITIAVPLIVSVLEFATRDTIDFMSVFCMLLSSAVSFSAAALSLFKFHSKWTRYRDYTEKLIGKIIFHLHIMPQDSAQNTTAALLEDMNKLNHEHQIS